MRPNKLNVIGVAIVAVVLALAGDAFAQGNVIRQISDMNRAAMEDYDLLEFESAKKQLTDALTLAKKSKLGKHPVVARTFMNLGIVYGGGLGDMEQAVANFAEAIRIDPTIELDPAYRSPEMTRLYDQAKAGVDKGGAAPAGGGDEGGGEAPAEVRGLVHRLVDEAAAGKDVMIEVQVGDDVGAKKIVLYYRPEGAADFTPVAMRKARGKAYAAKIPGKATKDVSSVHYYIVAVSADGKTLATSASPGSPNIITIDQSRTAPSDDGDEGGGGGGGDDEGGGGGDDENPLDGVDGVDREVEGAGGKSMFVSVSAGTGGGYITDSTESTSQPVKCCVALAPVHVIPEIGWWVGRQTTFSVYGRIGFPITANIEGHAKVGPAGLVRLAHYSRPDGSGLLIHGDLGFGFVRHTVKLKNVPTDTMGDTDTYAMGPLLVGGGAGWAFAMSPKTRFILDGNVLMGIPVVSEIQNSKPGFGVNVDVSGGLQFSF